jgi:hypothetical protein
LQHPAQGSGSPRLQESFDAAGAIRYMAGSMLLRFLQQYGFILLSLAGLF